LEKLESPVKIKVARQLTLAALLLLGAWGISRVLGVVAAEASPNPLDSAAGLSQAAANAFQAKMMELSSTGPARSRSLKPVVITDAELNSFVKYGRPPVLPPGVTNVDLHFKPEGVEGAADVNFDELKPTEQFGNQLGSMLLASIFRGTQHVTALGVLASQDGTGTLTIKNVHIGNTVLSDWLVNWFMQTYIQSEYKIDLSKPFLLPSHVLRIEFAPGKAIFVRGIKQKK